jgi:hypothetical protein
MTRVPMLSFQRGYMDAILAGRKTATVRRVHNHLPKRGDDIVLTNGPRPAFAHAVVRRVERFTLAECPRWYRADGHASPEVMHAAIVELYGDHAELVVIEFRLRRAPRRSGNARRQRSTAGRRSGT